MLTSNEEIIYEQGLIPYPFLLSRFRHHRWRSIYVEKEVFMKPLVARIIHFEKRDQIRVNLYAHALVKKGGAEFSFPGEIINISSSGAYLATNGQASLNDQLDVTIYFQHGTKKLSITVPSIVTRIDGTGVGLTSSDIDPNMLQHLELIFDLNKEKTKQLIDEFIKYICLIDK